MNSEIYIAIWVRDTGLLDTLIRFFTHGKGYHAAFIRRNGRIIENFYPGVRERGWKPGEWKQVEFYRLCGMSASATLQLENWFQSELKKPRPYSIADLFRYAFGLPPHPGRGGFCSMWVLRGLRLNLSGFLQPLCRLPYPDYASPRDLRISPALLRVDPRILGLV